MGPARAETKASCSLKELAAVEILAHDGKADLNKIQVEAFVMNVIKERFAKARPTDTKHK